MKIVVFGAGAIGSFIGGVLSKNNDVVLIGRKQHVNSIKEKGLKIQGKTKLNVKIRAEDDIGKIDFSPDILILTVKSYDTENAIKEAKKIINENTLVLSFQNGLDNIEKIKKHVNENQILVGITTHGCIFSKPGIITHTGIGKTTIGDFNKEPNRTKDIIDMFNKAGIKTTLSQDIEKETWIKGIINSSINPLTSFFGCKNGYLIENPILEKIVEKICEESTNVANVNNFNLSCGEMIDKTKEVIRDTAENYSSMLQSIQNSKKTEIDSINGKIVELGEKNNLDVSLNKLLVHLIKSL